MNKYIWGNTYACDEKYNSMNEILKAAVDYNMSTDEYLVPSSYWMDKRGWLYIQWVEKNNAKGKVVRYKFGDDKNLIIEKIKYCPRKDERLRGENLDAPVVLITGDTHRVFRRITEFCQMYNTTKDDILIILGDVGINYCEDTSDIQIKNKLAQLPITLFCVHGNHEQRPENITTYKLAQWHGGKVYMEEQYPNLIFAKDGEIYNIGDKNVIVIGGAYSVDKMYRLGRGGKWFPDEQASEETKQYVEKQLANRNWKIDVVLSHTLPYQYRPVDLFLDFIDQSTVDNSMEKWLATLEERLTYEKWYAGHYHCDRVVDHVQIMYRNVEVFCGDGELKFSKQ